MSPKCMQLYVKVTKLHKRIHQKGLRRSVQAYSSSSFQMNNRRSLFSLPPSIHPVFYFLPHTQCSKYTCQLQTTAGSAVIKKPALPVGRAHTLHTWLRRACKLIVITVTQSACSSSQTLVSGRADTRDECHVNPAALLNSSIHTAHSHPDHGSLMRNQTLAFDGSRLSSPEQLTGFSRLGTDSPIHQTKHILKS